MSITKSRLILPGKSHGGGVSMGPLRVGQDWATSLSLFTFMYWRRKWQPTPVWRIPGTGEPGGLPSVGSHRVGHDWSDLAAAVAAARAHISLTSNWTPGKSSDEPGPYLLSNSYSAIAHCPHEMYLRTNLEYFRTTEWNHSMCLVYLS